MELCSQSRGGGSFSVKLAKALSTLRYSPSVSIVHLFTAKFYVSLLLLGSMEAAANSDLSGGSIESSTSLSIDSNSPLYMHPSDNPGAMLVPVQFTGIGYQSWRHSVLRSVFVKNKLGFISGDCPRPQADIDNGNDAMTLLYLGF
ncbi:hypothetical protein KY290_013946 [Solanum tuberosum]|uniref:Retrotransposon Copia-like N-terminal domain-containing protein n=1 Tax=Solanum tuberosum TaxID=4113 RepID=A0ABQ7VQB1_SOLTU|nr:hypothetical protein KY285_013363 [Solanum tuberosum]KAH0769965.1 hypothetical protein KY290_013946 [Solanum tuberosum]